MVVGRFWPSSNFGRFDVERREEKDSRDRTCSRAEREKERIRTAFTPRCTQTERGGTGYEKELRWLSKAGSGFEGWSVLLKGDPVLLH